MKYLDNPRSYNLFRDPYTKQFFIEILSSKKASDLHYRYDVKHKQGLINKIKRIVGKFGIKNYTELKKYLIENGIEKSLRLFKKFGLVMAFSFQFESLITVTVFKKYAR